MEKRKASRAALWIRSSLPSPKPITVLSLRITRGTFLVSRLSIRCAAKFDEFLLGQLMRSMTSFQPYSHSIVPGGLEVTS